MIKIVQENIEALRLLCEKYSVSELYLFGSAVSEQVDVDISDLDFAVVFSNKLSPIEHGDSFFALKDSLEELFSKEIDLISYRVVKNPIFKEELDKTKIELYAA